MALLPLLLRLEGDASLISSGSEGTEGTLRFQNESKPLAPLLGLFSSTVERCSSLSRTRQPTGAASGTTSSFETTDLCQSREPLEANNLARGLLPANVECLVNLRASFIAFAVAVVGYCTAGGSTKSSGISSFRSSVLRKRNLRTCA